MRFYLFYFVAVVSLMASTVAEAANAGQYHSPDEWWFFQVMGALGGFSF
jgi:hypothetical protein